jgi:hypothetical protein
MVLALKQRQEQEQEQLAALAAPLIQILVL